MLRVGDLVINLNSIAYVNLNSRKENITGCSAKGVRIFFLSSSGEGSLSWLFFQGEDAEYLRNYFNAVARECTPEFE